EHDVVGGIHYDGDDVPLAHAHPGLNVISLFSQRPGLEHLRREVFWIGVEVPEQPFELCSFGLWSKGRTAPVVQQRAGEIGAFGRREALDNQLSAAQAPLRIFKSGTRRSEKAVR